MWFAPAAKPSILKATQKIAARIHRLCTRNPRTAQDAPEPCPAWTQEFICHFRENHSCFIDGYQCWLALSPCSLPWYVPPRRTNPSRVSSGKPVGSHILRLVCAKRGCFTFERLSNWGGVPRRFLVTFAPQNDLLCRENG